MEASLLGIIRDSKGFYKATTWLVVCAFVFVYYSPSALAAKQAIEQQQVTTTHIEGESDEERLANALQKIKEHVSKNKDKISKRVKKEGSLFEQALDFIGFSSLEPESIAELTTLYDEIESLHVKAKENFDAIEAQLKDMRLPEEILQRHYEAVKKYQIEYGKLQNNMSRLKGAKSLYDQEEAAEGLDKFLKSQEFKPDPKPFDPNNLPFRTHDGKVRPPKQTEEEYKSSLFKPEPIRLAAIGSLMGISSIDNLPTEADLQATIDIQITQAIQNLAVELNNDPLRIYNWVRDNIDFIPTFGSVQGSDLTLKTRRGNAFDISSLLIALLRSAGIPARYAYGTIEVPSDQFMNWAGGFTDINTAGRFVASGGIPSVGVTVGGQVRKVRLEHIWVQAWVDYEPSRGAKNIEGDSWVAIDAAFKQYDQIEGLGLNGVNSGFDFQNLLNEIGLLGNTDQNGGFTWLEEKLLDTDPETFADTRFNEFQSPILADAVSPTEFQDRIYGKRTIIPSVQPTLPSALPYDVFLIGSNFSELPDNLRHTVTLKLFRSELDLSLGQPVVTHSISLPELNSRRLGITYEPASSADAQVLENVLSQGATSLPLYLINVKPILKVDGEAVVVGPDIGMGQRQIWSMTLEDPESRANSPNIYRVSAGDELVFGINGNGITPSIIQDRFGRVPLDTEAENLHQVALNYWLQYDLINELSAKISRVHQLRLPSAGLFATPLSVSSFFGVPRVGSYKRRIMDVQRSLHVVQATSNDDRLNFSEFSGLVGSYLESYVFDQMFSKRAGNSIAAAQLLQDAARFQVPVYSIDQSNKDAILPLLSISRAALSDITSALAAGKTVIVSQRALGDFLGYIIRDPVTGAGAYLISGSLNGGAQSFCNEQGSLVTAPATLPTLGMIGFLTAVLFGFVILALLPLEGAAAVVVLVVLGVGITITAGDANAKTTKGPGDCSCQEHLNNCLDSSLQSVPGRCQACFNRCTNIGEWPPSIDIGISDDAPGGEAVLGTCSY